jgi:methenyltetrahydrofolate cyclohydrolase
MKLIDLKIEEFMNEVDSNKPAPGGGSVSALASALGVSLARMVGHLTIGKKKYEALNPEIKENFTKIHHMMTAMKDELTLLIDRDTEAFNQIMEAYKLPKANEDEIKLRKQKIEQATLYAIDIPIQVARLSVSMLQQLEYILTYSNKNTTSDLGCAVLLLSAGAEGAILNVKINLSGLDNEDIQKAYQKETFYLLQEIQTYRSKLLKQVESSL